MVTFFIQSSSANGLFHYVVNLFTVYCLWGTVDYSQHLNVNIMSIDDWQFSLMKTSTNLAQYWHIRLGCSIMGIRVTGYGIWYRIRLALMRICMRKWSWVTLMSFCVHLFYILLKTNAFDFRFYVAECVHFLFFLILIDHQYSSSHQRQNRLRESWNKVPSLRIWTRLEVMVLLKKFNSMWTIAIFLVGLKRPIKEAHEIQR